MAEVADEWLAIWPGSEARLAQALRSMISDPARSESEAWAASEATGIPVGELLRLAQRFAEAGRKVALPGGMALAQERGLEAAQAILALNVAASNLGKPGGVFLMPGWPLYPAQGQRPNTIAEIGALIEGVRQGLVKAVFIHGANPAAETPEVYGFVEALRRAELVISFSPVHDESSALADYHFPDHPALESWGYQRAVVGDGRMALSTIQPVAPPQNDTRSTARVLLSAARAAGMLSGEADFTTDEDFVMKTLDALNDLERLSNGGEAWEVWKRQGGWWMAEALRMPAVAQHSSVAGLGITDQIGFVDDAEAYALTLFPALERASPGSRTSADGGSQVVELHPQTAGRSGLEEGDLVRVISAQGETAAILRLSTALHPEALVLYPNGMRDWLKLVGRGQNFAGSMAVAGLRVRAEKI
jgi:anaerobic selenocysteine-containing dehydrogenase